MRTGFAMQLHDDTLVPVDTPNKYNGLDESEWIFDSACFAISAEWTIRQKKGLSGNIAWLETAAYQLLSRVCSERLGALIEKRIASYGRSRQGNTTLATLFRRGLLAIFAHDRSSSAPTDQQRASSGKRLWHAYRHYVPPEFLIGFLEQTSASLDKSRSCDWIIPAFVSWVIQQRAQDVSPETRGPYPEEVEQQITSYQGILRIMNDVEARRSKSRKAKEIRAQETGL